MSNSIIKDVSPFVDEYVNFLKGFLNDEAKGVNVIFDCSSGAAGPVVERLFPDSIILNGRPDGNFPNHAPDPLHKGSLDVLQQRVVSDMADVGVIFDADGDRAFFVDDKGHFVDPDTIAYLLLWSLRPKRFITDPKAGWVIRRQPFGMQHVMSKTGHYYIKQAMRKADALFGCERSGHYYFKDFFFCDSGIMSAIAVLNALMRLPYRLSDLVALLPTTYRSEEINVPINIAQYDALLMAIEQLYKKDATRITKLDGITMEFLNPDWWFNIRSSNTEPLARLNVEARDKSVRDAQAKKLTGLLKKGSK